MIGGKGGNVSDPASYASDSLEATVEVAVELPASQKFKKGQAELVTDPELDVLIAHLAHEGDIQAIMLNIYLEELFSTYEKDNIAMLMGVFGCSNHSSGLKAHSIDVDSFKQTIRSKKLRIAFQQISQQAKRSSSDTSRLENVDRQVFADTLAETVDRNDAMNTLPTTCVFMVVFIILVNSHLQIYNRFLVERGIENWINGYASFEGPFLTDIHTVDNFWTWIEKDGSEAIFADTRGNREHRTEVARIAVANDVISDVRLTSFPYNKEGTEPYWVRHSSKIGPDNHTTLVGEVKAALRQLREAGIFPKNEVSKINLQFCTYNPRLQFVCFVEVSIPIEKFGAARPFVKAVALPVHAYSDLLVVIPDAMYICIVLFLTFSEVRDCARQARMGFNEWLDYWTIWNAVDWFSIVLGFLNVWLWCQCCFAMKADSIVALFDTHTWELRAGTSALPAAALEQLLSEVLWLKDLFMALHVIIALNTFSIVLRYLKAFQANDRLKLVADTFASTYNDIVHFLFVFILMFNCFSIVGHVLFGGDLVEFRTIAASMNTGLTVLMGDFEWYREEIHKKRDTIGSNMPMILLHIWFFLFTVLIVLVMLNMLLAIIIGQYTEVRSSVFQRAYVPTLLQQAVDRLRFSKESWRRRFIHLKTISAAMENDANPAHRSSLVNEQSLKEAFTNMSDGQAKWLKDWIDKAIAMQLDNVVDVGETTTQKRVVRSLKFVAEEMTNVANRVNRCLSQISRIEMKIQTSNFAVHEESHMCVPQSSPPAEPYFSPRRYHC